MRPDPPPPIIPTPAAQFSELRGRRVIVGVPGMGFRADLRADNPVVNGGRTFVPVLTEQDYYRAESDQIEVFAPLVPVDRVWVEQAEQRGVQEFGPLDAPPRQEPAPANKVPRATGRRMVQAVPDGFIRDLRAVTEVFVNATGVPALRVCGEFDWYRWATTGTVPAITEVAADLLWAE